MKHIAVLLSILLATAFLLAATTHAATKVTSLTRHDITWTFDKEHTVGQFVNGDSWVIGPVNIISITNTLSDEKYKPEGFDVSGSMVNPTVDNSSFAASQRHGFDERVKGYDPALNAALPNGKPLSKDNPLALKPNQSLVSTVSWLWLDPEQKEDGCPKVPEDWRSQAFVWPTLRAASVLTVLTEAPPEGSFRPPYAGDDKTIKFNAKNLRLDRLRNLPPPDSIIAAPVPAATLHDHATLRPNYTPPLDGDPPHKPGPISVDTLTRLTSRVWLDLVPGWYGSCVLHPSYNLPIYGREISTILQQAMLALHLDWDKFPEKPNKKALAINMAQIGIDLAGVADAGGYWPADGGHAHGRYPAIIFAGLLLDDEHMKNAAQWSTRFQEREQVFYVTETDIQRSADLDWRDRPFLDKRSGNIAPYKKEMLGMPEWGIRHVEIPNADNAGWNAMYRDINAAAIVGFALALMMTEDGRKTFAHEPYFDYADRLKSSGEALFSPWYNRPPTFAQDMWEAHRADYPTTYDKKWDAPEITDYITKPKEQ